ncbi:DUF975 family protein [bacterium]|nr:DUF975 family protein [bacterium]
MNLELISLGRCFSDGWEAFKEYIGISIGVFVVYTAINMAAGYIPVIGQIWQLTGGFVLAGGFVLFFLKVLKSENPSFGDLFSQFSDFVRWLGVAWLLILYTLIAAIISAIPCGLFALIGLAAGKESSLFQILLGIGAFISVVILYCIVIRWAYVFYAAADEGLTAKAAIVRSEELTAGIRPQVFWVTLVAGLVAVAGAIVFGVGVLFTIPLSYCIMTALYLNTKTMRSGDQQIETPTDSSTPTL